MSAYLDLEIAVARVPGGEKQRIQTPVHAGDLEPAEVDADLVSLDTRTPCVPSLEHLLTSIFQYY
jgi:hypothetical protein